MSLPLTAAIQNGRPWLDRFTRLEYRKAFRAYMDQYGKDCLALIQNAQDPEVLAEEVLGELEAGRKKLRFWNRGERIFDEKQTVIKYFAPMLLELGCEDFAQIFRTEVMPVNFISIRKNEGIYITHHRFVIEFVGST